MGLEIVEANPNEPYRVMIYGPEGVGKSTFGAMSENPVFISPEGGTGQLRDRNGRPVKAVKGVTTFDQIRRAIRDLTTEKHDFNTLVLDSADWTEKACHAKIGDGKDIIRANGGYGAGYRGSESLHRELIHDLDALQRVRGMNFILTAHAHVKEVKDPDAPEAYDAFEIKCHEYVSSLWREWVQALIFVRFRTYIKEGDDMKKARAFGDDSRVAYTTKRPAFQAKNRFSMPHEMNFDLHFFDQFIKYARSGARDENAEDVLEDIHEMRKLVTEEATAKAVDEYIAKSGTNVTQLKQIRERLKAITAKPKEESNGQ